MLPTATDGSCFLECPCFNPTLFMFALDFQAQPEPFVKSSLVRLRLMRPHGVHIHAASMRMGSIKPSNIKLKHL